MFFFCGTHGRVTIYDNMKQTPVGGKAVMRGSLVQHIRWEGRVAIQAKGAGLVGKKVYVSNDVSFFFPFVFRTL